MANATHTPGPWEAKFYAPGDSYRITYLGTDNWLADVWIDGAATQAIADARLIAAAPDLLDALERLVRSDNAFEHADALEHAETVIDRAKGQ